MFHKTLCGRILKEYIKRNHMKISVIYAKRFYIAKIMYAFMNLLFSRWGRNCSE